VVVTTAGDCDNTPNVLMENYILPAIKEDKPIASNQSMVNKLQQLSQHLEYPEPKPVKSLPDIAKRISGKTFICRPNNLGMESY
jgi:hypothetical protein